MNLQLTQSLKSGLTLFTNLKSDITSVLLAINPVPQVRSHLSL